jgi:hypothetical protein
MLPEVELKKSDPQITADKSISDSGHVTRSEAPETKAPDEPKAPCKACGTPMPIGASLCPTCKTYQHWLTGWLQFYGTIAALLVLSASLLGWLGSVLPNLRRNFMPRHHLSVVSANSNESLVVFNDGDKDLFLNYVFLAMSGRNSDWIAPYVPIQAGVPVGQFYRHEFHKPYTFEKGEFVRGLQESQWQQLLTQAVSNPQCFNPFYLGQGDPFYKMISHMAGPSLNTFPVYAHVEYVVPGDPTTHRAVFPAVGIIHRDPSKACSGSQ